MSPQDTWQDHMPAIPLARGVPLWLMANKGFTLAPVGRCDLYDADRFVFAAWGMGHTLPLTKRGPVDAIVRVRMLPTGGEDPAPIGVAISRLRVDLGDPQGMGYALRWLACAGWIPNPRAPSGSMAWQHRHVRGSTTDADRLALAKACALVQA